jgi:hypothetical protein
MVLFESSHNSSAVTLTLTEISIRPHPLPSSPLCLWYSDSSGISIIRSTSGSHFASAFKSLRLIRSGSLQCCQNVGPWVSISFSWIGKSYRERRPVSVCRIHRNQKLQHEWRVNRRFDRIQGPGIVSPLVWICAPDVFHKSLKKVAIEFSRHCLSRWKMFLMHSANNVKGLPHFPSWFRSKFI